MSDNWICWSLFLDELESFFLKTSQTTCSSSSSSPLLSLVQVPAKLAINLSIHTQHTYDNGVDRTGRQGIKKNTAFYMRRERRKKKMFNPQTMLHLEYSLRTEKKTPQHKSTYTINTWLATGETYPALASSRPVRCHLLRRRSQDLLALVAVQSVTEAVEWGRGVMSVVGEGSKRVYTASLSQGSYPDGLGQGAGTGSQKR